VSCERNFEKLNLYIDGELDECEKLLMEEHIKNCERCRKEFELLLSIKKVLGEVEKEEIPAGFQVKISEDALKGMRRKFFLTNLRPAVYLAAIVFIFFASYSILSYGFLSKKSNPEMKEISVTMQAPETNQSKEGAETSNGPDQSTNETKIPDNTTNTAKNMDKQKSVVTDKSKYTLFSLTSRNSDNRTINTTYEKKIIRNASISLVTYNIEETMNKILELTESNRGYIETLSSYTDKEGNDIISITFRIPAENFYVVLYNSFNLKGFTTFEEHATDVTDEYYGLNTQIQLMESKKGFGIKLPGVGDDKSKAIDAELNELTTKKSQLENRIALSTIKYDIKKVNKH